MRQKLKAFKRLYDAGRMTLDDIKVSVQCWIAYALHFCACGTVKTMVDLVYTLFGAEEGHEIMRIKRVRKNSIARRRIYISRYSEATYRRLAA